MLSKFRTPALENTFSSEFNMEFEHFLLLTAQGFYVRWSNGYIGVTQTVLHSVSFPAQA